RLPGDIEYVFNFLVGALGIHEHKPAGELGFQRNGGKTIAEQIMQIARKTHPLISDSQASEFTSCGSQISYDKRTPGEPAYHKPGVNGGDKQIGNKLRTEPKLDRYHEHSHINNAKQKPRGPARDQNEHRTGQEAGHAAPLFAE